MAELVTVEVRCPKCGRFMFEASDFGRAVCAEDGWEVMVTSPTLRRRPSKSRYPIGGT